MVGKVFNRLTVMSEVGRVKQGAKLWACECICGKYKYTTSRLLNAGKVESCGCLDRDKVQAKHEEHIRSQQGKKGLKRKIRLGLVANV